MSTGLQQISAGWPNPGNLDLKAQAPKLMLQMTVRKMPAVTMVVVTVTVMMMMMIMMIMMVMVMYSFLCYTWQWRGKRLGICSVTVEVGGS